MTLPASGPLSLSAINTEFGRGTNLNAYRGTGWYTDAGGSGTFSTSALSISEFYNKRLTSPQFSFTISSNQTNANLRTLAVNAGWNQSSKVVATINSGVYVSSNSTGTPALTVNGSFPNGVQLINNGIIVGMGGAGGATFGGSGPGYNGNAGGTGLAVSVAVSISNNNTIAGGGGGGGGGSTRYAADEYGATVYSTNKGGSGGRSSAAANSAGGYGFGGNGFQGTVSAPGARNDGSQNYGGAGGAWGSAGESGYAAYPAPWPNGSGGSGGAAVSGSGNVTWLATGTRLGLIS